MNLAISQRAFDLVYEPQLMPRLVDLGVKGLEVAVGRLPDGVHSKSGQLIQFADRYRSSGFDLCAIQSIFYGSQGINFFQSSQSQQAYLDHLLRVAECCHYLDIPIIVLGGYQQRMKGDISYPEASDRFASALSQIALQLPSGISIAVEAVPAAYGSDFLTDHQQVDELIRLVEQPNIKLHLDLGAAFTNQESVDELAHWSADAAHIHLAVPGFGLIHEASMQIDHAEYQIAISASPARYLSVEMFEHAAAYGIIGVLETVKFVKHQYQTCLDL